MVNFQPNAQNLAAQYDEFRLYWKGYSTGAYNITARAHLFPQIQPINSVTANITVSNDICGPNFTILSPISETVYSNPRWITVDLLTDLTAHSILVFITDDTGRERLLGMVNDPSSEYISLTDILDNPNTMSIEGPVVHNGIYPIRVIAATGNNGSGITTEQSVLIEIINWVPTSVEKKYLSKILINKYKINIMLIPIFICIPAKSQCEYKIA